MKNHKNNSLSRFKKLVGIILFTVSGLATYAQSPDWNTRGNGSIDPSADFVGTTEDDDLVFRTNNRQKMVIKSDGKIGVGTNTPNEHLTILGTKATVSIRNSTNGTYGRFSAEDDHNTRVSLNGDFVSGTSF